MVEPMRELLRRADDAMKQPLDRQHGGVIVPVIELSGALTGKVENITASPPPNRAEPPPARVARAFEDAAAAVEAAALALDQEFSSAMQLLRDTAGDLRDKGKQTAAAIEQVGELLVATGRQVDAVRGSIVKFKIGEPAA